MSIHPTPSHGQSGLLSKQSAQPSPLPVLTGHIMKRAVDLGGRERQWEQTIDPSMGKEKREGEKQHLPRKGNIFPTERTIMKASDEDTVQLTL